MKVLAALKRLGRAVVYLLAGTAGAVATWFATWVIVVLIEEWFGSGVGGDREYHAGGWMFVAFGVVALIGFFVAVVRAGTYSFSPVESGPPIYGVLLATLAFAPAVFMIRDPDALTALASGAVVALLALCLPGNRLDDLTAEDALRPIAGVGLTIAVALVIGLASTKPIGSPSSANGTNCSPNYEPCVPNADYDLDCPDIGHSVAVVGTDEHGFDANKDGEGCEGW